MTQGRDAEEVIGRARFVPPKLRQHILHRPRVGGMLAHALEYPLTVVKAEAGYGKTTAVASFLSQPAGLPHAWYNVGDTDVDPQSFLVHLVHALRTLHPAIGTRSLARLAQLERSPRAWAEAIDSLSNDLLDSLTTETVLVLDDYDRADRAEVNAITERLVESMPPLMHIIITARTMPSLRNRARWRASNELLVVTRAELAFTADEVVSLFGRRLAEPLSEDAARAVALETEGWPIALQMMSNGLDATHRDALDNVLRRIPGPAELLFDYLAEEVFLRQSSDIRQFLGESACLRRLDPDACDYTMGIEGSAEVLRFLEQSSLFLTFDGAFRYHNLFSDFLRRRAGITTDRMRHLHRRAAEYYALHGDDEEQVHHLFAAGDHEAAALALPRIAAKMAATGRHQALGEWLDRLPHDVLSRSPELLLARGDSCRLTSRYTDSLAAYQQARAQSRARNDSAGELRAIRGQVLLFLDTVQPALAAPLLREARAMPQSDMADRISLYTLLAENTLNEGDTRAAERLFRAVYRVAYRDEVAPSMNPRLYVRQGRFTEARDIVDTNRRAEPAVRPGLRAPRSHREAGALLAWIGAMVGDAAAARQHAAESLDVGRMLGSPIVEGISLGRLGLAWLTGRDYDPVRAREHFDEAMRMTERIGVPRFRVEPLMGLIIMHGLAGRHEDAESCAREAFAIVDASGDRYVRTLTHLALGGSLVLCSRANAEHYLRETIRMGEESGDAFAPCAARLWLALHYSRTQRLADARTTFRAALAAAQHNDYAFLLNGTALFAVKDVTAWKNLLRRAQEDPDAGDYAQIIARTLEPDDEFSGAAAARALSTAPLYLQTLGPFRAWRKGQEVDGRAWSREKALHLLQLLLCHRGRAMHREQILDALWPRTAAATAATGLRVALSALRNALEPERESGSDGHFLLRDGDNIRLAMEAGITVDADEMTRMLASAKMLEHNDVEQAIALYEEALALYRGEFLGDNRYAAWAEDERLRARSEFLAGAERLAKLLSDRAEWERATRWAETILQHDALWEPAYALLMQCQWAQGNRALAIRAFERCRKRLHDQLGVAPSAATMTLYEKIAQPDLTRAKLKRSGA